MKYILLLRHAKSSHNNAGIEDFDRPLTKQGSEDASSLGRYIKNIGYLPDQIISSTAKRARQTSYLFSKSSGVPKEQINWNDDFYNGSSFNYLKEIHECGKDFKTVMLVGHNPNIEETASLLCSEQQSYVVRMPPAALVCFEHPAVTWNQIKEGTARIKWMITPKLLKKLIPGSS